MFDHPPGEYPEPKPDQVSVLPVVVVALAAFGIITMLSIGTEPVRQSPPLIREAGPPGPVPVTDRRPQGF